MGHGSGRGQRFCGGETVINVEGVELLNFEPNPLQLFGLTTQLVRVRDGKLTLDGIGGSNSKINYLEIESASPDVTRIRAVSPNNFARDVSPQGAINLDLALSGAGNGIDSNSLNDDNISLARTLDGVVVPGSANTTGGDDAIVFQPSIPLDPHTQYTFNLNGALDLEGNPFTPVTTSFTTGADEPDSNIIFERTQLLSDIAISTLEIAPAGDLLYGASLTGDIYRWEISTNGSLSNRQTFSRLNHRTVVGMVFDPDDPNVLWLSHNENIYDTVTADNFTGKVSRLRLNNGAEFTGTVEDYVTGLPRSSKRHFSNSLEFGPDGALYLSQGSNSATGAPDATWDYRPETLLTASILRIDPDLKPPQVWF
ncbi:MAG: Ig-like domain-containing protein [Cyanobacteria bacterium J06623_7]